MPQITARERVRFLKSQGFEEDRLTGSHLTMVPPGQVTVVHTGCDLGRGFKRYGF
ncbi:MAG TPA: type II toxin-antitoxin system HicA family toxin [Terriglobia bacterium]